MWELDKQMDSEEGCGIQTKCKITMKPEMIQLRRVTLEIHDGNRNAVLN